MPLEASPQSPYECPTCGAAHLRRDPLSIYAGCSGCGMLLDITTQPPLAVVPSFAPEEIPAAPEGFAPGTLLVWEETPWLVVGRKFYFEYYVLPKDLPTPAADAEEPIATDRAPTADEALARIAQDRPLEEAVLMGPDRSLAFLQQAPENSAGGLILGKRISPKVEALPTDRLMLNFFTGAREPIHRRGILELGFVVGETRYPFEHQGDAFEFADYTAEAERQYRMKYRRGAEPGKFEAAEYYQMQPISAAEVQHALAWGREGKYTDPGAPALPAPTAAGHSRKGRNLLARLFGGNA